MRDFLLDNGYAILGAATIGLFGLGIYLGIQEQKQWDAFAQTHECKLIAHANGFYTSGSGWSNGKSVIVSQYHPSTNTYHCNDGVDYTR